MHNGCPGRYSPWHAKLLAVPHILPIFRVTRYPSGKRSGRTRQVCQRTVARNICQVDISQGHFASEMSARYGPLGLCLSARSGLRPALVGALPSVACQHGAPRLVSRSAAALPFRIYRTGAGGCWVPGLLSRSGGCAFRPRTKPGLGCPSFPRKRESAVGAGIGFASIGIIVHACSISGWGGA
jgi:hypothetical protein